MNIMVGIMAVSGLINIVSWLAGILEVIAFLRNFLNKKGKRIHFLKLAGKSAALTFIDFKLVGLIQFSLFVGSQSTATAAAVSVISGAISVAGMFFRWSGISLIDLFDKEKKQEV